MTYSIEKNLETIEKYLKNHFQNAKYMICKKIKIWVNENEIAYFNILMNVDK